MKKLIPAICLLLVSAVMLGTSTFAWFSMNATVTVTGMSVRASVKENISIASTAVTSTAKEADSAFKSGYVATHTETVLEPVSAVDGATFFYTSTKNVKADGDAKTDTYVAYNHADTSAFDTNYGTTGAKGYVEYAVQLKADNSSDAARYVNLTDVNLTYGGAAADQKAFRVAIFVDDMGTDGATAASATQTTSNLKSILSISGAAYQTTGKAVSSVSALDTVNAKLNAAALIGTVDAHTSHYYKVVVRLWMEGEDTTCTNTTFASLTDKWAFDVVFKLQDTTGGATAINQALTASKIDLSTAPSTGSEAKVVDGVNYYEIAGNTGYYTTVASTAVSSSSIIYNIDSNDIVLDVTNRCTLPA